MTKYEHNTYRALKALANLSSQAMESQQNLQRLKNSKLSQLDPNKTVYEVLREVSFLESTYNSNMKALEGFLENVDFKYWKI